MKQYNQELCISSISRCFTDRLQSKKLKWKNRNFKTLVNDDLNFHLFHSLQNNLNDRNFSYVEAIENYLTSLSTENGILQLVQLLQAISENDEDYIIDSKRVMFYTFITSPSHHTDDATTKYVSYEQ